MKQSNTNRTVIINATNIGGRPSGIGVYSLNLLRMFARLEPDIKFVVYLNRNCHSDIFRIRFPANFTIRWVTGLVSPDYGGIGHGMRLLLANIISLLHWKSLLFNTSQLEAGLFHRRQIVTIHDLIPLLFPKQHRKQYPFFKWILPLALRSAATVVTPSNHTRHLIERWLPVLGNKIKVIANGKQEPPPRRYSSLGQARPSILFVGRLCHIKNIAALLDAFTMIYPGILHRLLIAGNDEKHLEQLRREKPVLNELEKTGRIELLGHLPQDDLFQLMTSASVFVFPSLYEGFGMPPLEAMASGCPVIVSHKGSLPEVCGKAALYIDPQDPAQIAAAIKQVIGNSAMRNTLIGRGYARASGFQWRQSAIAHLELIRGHLATEPLPRPVPYELETQQEGNAA